MILYACATAPPAVIEADPGILRVGVSPDAPPLIFKQNDKISGLEAEMAMALADYLEKTAVFVEVPWEDQIPALLDNRTDIIMSGMSVTLGQTIQNCLLKALLQKRTDDFSEGFA